MRIDHLPKKLGRILVSVDSANVAIGLRDHGLTLDYKKFVDELKKYGRSLQLYYYGPKFPSQKHQNFLTFLKKLGFRLRTKEVKVIADKLGDHRKANFDVELAIDTVDLKQKFDTLVLLSGDSDFAAIVHYLHNQKKKVYILSSRGSVAVELVRESDGYVVLNEWKSILKPYKKYHPDFRRGK